MYGITPEEIIKWNSLQHGKELVEGQQLIVSRNIFEPAGTTTDQGQQGQQASSQQNTGTTQQDNHQATAQNTSTEQLQGNNATANQNQTAQQENTTANQNQTAGNTTANQNQTAQQGNTTAIQTNRVAASSVTHEVEIGETLYSIAKRYNVKVPDVQALNNLTSNEVNAGQRLAMPAGAVLQASANTAKTTKTKAASSVTAKNAKKHTIRKGDSLYEIAQKYKLTLDQLLAMNNMTSKSLILPGSKLIVDKNYKPLKYHTVEQGETMYSISKKYNLSLTELKSLNNKSNGEVFKGEKLRVQ